MKALLYWIIDVISHIHEDILHLNDAMEASFTDKELHFIVIGVLGMLIFFAVHAVFKRLAKFSITAVSFIYVFTVMVVITFAIEIGQKVSGTGNMDFGDIVSGMWGFIALFGVYALVRAGAALFRLLARRIRAGRPPRDESGN
ncbi:hypothetical protein [Beduinella massiliensis]|uniref:hypothetical protein n=1 Tax=Beduinella massiliensis TaxID=1852363 RepID=UPI000C85366C